jgi:hypothetical protein
MDAERKASIILATSTLSNLDGHSQWMLHLQDSNLNPSQCNHEWGEPAARVTDELILV